MTNPALKHLKGFQRAAVEHAFHRLYDAPDSTHRFLIADEVGLGKTLIARGIITKSIERLRRERVKRIDIVYICSNQQIAKQNMRRLDVTRDPISEDASRITLLPLTMGEVESRDLNFIALTPGTSLDLKSRLGIAKERLLLHAMTTSCWELPSTGALNVFQGNSGRESFRARAKRFREDYPISPSLERRFCDELCRSDSAAPPVEARLRDLCQRFARGREFIPEEDSRDRARLVSDLRTVLARTCIEAIEPDLVILDEFQRFRDLLDGSSDAGRLAAALFGYANGRESTRVLLLSATPYKPYTLSHERDEDDHYADFLRTVDFLDPDEDHRARFRAMLDDWRRSIFQLDAQSQGDVALATLRAAKAGVEGHLRRLMSRTERIAASSARGGMLREVRPEQLQLRVEDVLACARLQALADELESPQVLDYWKSAPFPLNFMEKYLLKNKLMERIGGRSKRAASRLVGLIESSRASLLDWTLLERYQALDPHCPAMRALLADLDRAGAYGILWVPPSMPYWRLGGSFVLPHACGFTKRLAFSAWNVVPKAIAAIASYEAERQLFRAAEDAPRNTATARKRRAPLLRFSKSEGRLAGMPVMTLVYASPSLARFGDVIPLAESGGDLWSVECAIENTSARLRPFLDEVVRAWSVKDAHDSRPDEAWYWAAPILLDIALEGAAAERYWEERDLAKRWISAEDEAEDDAGGAEAEERTGRAAGPGSAGTDDVAEGESDVGWRDHVSEVQALLRGELLLGAPPSDLTETIARIALGGPATCALRAFQRVLDVPQTGCDPAVRLAACRVGWAFRSYFNRPESMAAIRSGHAETPYWRRVIEYAIEGCLTAATDEWAHVLREAIGLLDPSARDGPERLSDAMVEAITTRIAWHDVDEVTVKDGAVLTEKRSMRAHFAMRFASERTEDQKQLSRESQVRAAFNSPFWPFVLASTSVGQEGLDFHQFCHAVVHWNLPPNPVDLEQREGRVHRYKNHAIRRNVARRHGSAAIRTPGSGGGAFDPWAAAFRMALCDAPVGDPGLTPYWIYDPPELACPVMVERHVAYLPLSRDEARLRMLKRSLAAYRLVFGQPRQDDLMEFLQGRFDEATLAAWAEEVRVDLAPSTTGLGR